MINSMKVIMKKYIFFLDLKNQKEKSNTNLYKAKSILREN